MFRVVKSFTVNENILFLLTVKTLKKLLTCDANICEMKFLLISHFRVELVSFSLLSHARVLLFLFVDSLLLGAILPELFTHFDADGLSHAYALDASGF